MRPQAEVVMPIRDAIFEANALAERVEGLEADQPRWSAVIAELALILPLDTYLTDLSARGTLLQIEGYAVRTSTVVNAFQNSAIFGAARLAGPVTKEQTPAGERERFILEVPLDRREPGP
jgi:Tfp pilus assembly protein PilN